MYAGNLINIFFGNNNKYSQRKVLAPFLATFFFKEPHLNIKVIGIK